MKRCNPVWVDDDFDSFTQGSRVAPLLGKFPLPRWGNPNGSRDQVAASELGLDTLEPK